MSFGEGNLHEAVENAEQALAETIAQRNKLKAENERLTDAVASKAAIIQSQAAYIMSLESRNAEINKTLRHEMNDRLSRIEAKVDELLGSKIKAY